jgi:hypothetical protein
MFLYVLMFTLYNLYNLIQIRTAIHFVPFLKEKSLFCHSVLIIAELY